MLMQSPTIPDYSRTLFAAAVTALLWCVCSPSVRAQPAATALYVATNGNDAWSGRLPAPSKDQPDGPFATLERARDEIRKLKTAGPLATPVNVLIREGIYELARPLALGPEDTGTAETVRTIAALLSNKTAREDARMALERIPGEESLAALKSALKTARADFKANLAQSLRVRGIQVPGLACQKLKPMKQTQVTPVSR